MSARRPWLRPLVPLYAAVLQAKEFLRRGTRRPVRQLQWPVLSVGSLSAGGAGKTPVVIALARLLREHGWHVDVLSRGYGREGRGVERVIPDMSDAARRFGDEPALIAQSAAIPVWVGADRAAAGRKAEDQEQFQSLAGGHIDLIPAGGEKAPPHRKVHLLDDGFQHRQLARALDVVLVTAEDLDDTLLPAGNLREPLGALRRADVVVVRQDEMEAVRSRVWAHMREGAQIWTVRRRLVFPAPLSIFGAGLRPVAFCAIARPEGFATMLAEQGCGVVETVAFADHHPYTMADVERMVEIAAGLGGSGFVTTEKDAVKLTSAMRARLASLGPLMVVPLEAEFADRDTVMRVLEGRISDSASSARGISEPGDSETGIS